MPAPPYEGDPQSYTTSNLNATGLQGSCLCKSIHLTINQPDLFTRPNGHICHCLNCRRHTGSSAWTLLLLPARNLTISDPRAYRKTFMDADTASGTAIPRSFCSNCGSTVGNIPAGWENGEVVEGRPEFVSVALGLFPRMPEPEFELFSKHRQTWLPAVVAEGRRCEFREEMVGRGV